MAASHRRHDVSKLAVPMNRPDVWYATRATRTRWPLSLPTGSPLHDGQPAIPEEQADELPTLDYHAALISCPYLSKFQRCTDPSAAALTKFAAVGLSETPDCGWNTAALSRCSWAAPRPIPDVKTRRIRVCRMAIQHVRFVRLPCHDRMRVHDGMLHSLRAPLQDPVSSVSLGVLSAQYAMGRSSPSCDPELENVYTTMRQSH